MPHLYRTTWRGIVKLCAHQRENNVQTSGTHTWASEGLKRSIITWKLKHKNLKTNSIGSERWKAPSERSRSRWIISSTNVCRGPNTSGRLLSDRLHCVSPRATWPAGRSGPQPRFRCVYIPNVHVYYGNNVRSFPRGVDTTTASHTGEYYTLLLSYFDRRNRGVVMMWQSVG